MGSLPPLKRRIQRSHTIHAVAIALGVFAQGVVGIFSARGTKEAATLELASLAEPAKTSVEARIRANYRWSVTSSSVQMLFALAVGWLAVRIAAKKDLERVNGNSPDDFLCALHVFYEAVKKKKNLAGQQDERFRTTLHRVDDDEHHEQYLPYIGWGSNDPSKQPGDGRRWSNRQGLVGAALRMARHNEVLYVAEIDAGYDTREAVERVMVEKYAYTHHEAKLLSEKRLSSMVVVIQDETLRPVAALYCDSSERGFFCKDVQELALSAGVGIASFIRLKYPFNLQNS